MRAAKHNKNPVREIDCNAASAVTHNNNARVIDTDLYALVGSARFPLRLNLACCASFACAIRLHRRSCGTKQQMRAPKQ